MTPPSFSGWLRALLLASLSLNVLAAGVLAGSLLAGRAPWATLGDGPGRDRPGEGGPRRPPRAVDLTLGPFARALPEADRRAILEALRDDPDLRPVGPREREAAFADLVAALRADPYDAAGAAAALAARSEAVDAAETAVRAALLDHIAAMTPAERAAFAGRVEEELRRGPDGG